VNRIRLFAITLALVAGCSGAADITETQAGLSNDLPGCDGLLPSGHAVEQPLPSWGDGLSKLVVNGVEICVDSSNRVRNLVVNRASSNPMPGTDPGSNASSNPMPGTADGNASSNPMPGTDPNATASSNPMPGTGR
jgi:hypothetical protein